MSEPHPGTITIAAPAKLNLGLEVLGRRDDGFHEIATIFLAIDLRDSLTFTPADELEVRCDDPRVGGDENLVLRALRELRAATPSPPTRRPEGTRPTAAGEGGIAPRQPEALAYLPQPAASQTVAEEPLSLRTGRGVGVRVIPGAVVHLEKRIPIAAGLGGASTDAAAALRGARELWQLDISDAALRDIAAGLGSDVPFFLDGGCALGVGRGEVLTRLPMPCESWFVIVAPRVTIPAKTTTLFGSLVVGDFGDGSRVAAQAERLRAGLPLDAALLGNAFARALYARCPELAELPAIMREAGTPHVAISGAGPSHYAVLDDAERAARVAGALRERLGGWAEIFVVRPERERFSRSRPL